MKTCILYTVPACLAGKRLKTFLKDHQMPFQEKNLYLELLDPEKSQDLVRLILENPRRMLWLENPVLLRFLKENPDFEESDFAELIKKNPSLILRPVVFGWPVLNEHFEMLKENACKTSCSLYPTCSRCRKRDGGDNTFIEQLKLRNEYYCSNDML